MATTTAAYINVVGDDGWILGKAGDGTLRPIYKYAKVLLGETKKGRTYFTPQEGASKGVMLSMTEANAKIYLGAVGPLAGVAQIDVKYKKFEKDWYSRARDEKLDQQWAALTVGEVVAAVTMNTVWNGVFFPLPAGTYDVAVPDAPHGADMTRFYRKVEPALRSDQVWFPILYGDNSRYVHVGNVSDGCVTVASLDKWTAICEALLKHRSKDGKLVAKLTVSGTPERKK